MKEYDENNDPIVDYQYYKMFKFLRNRTQNFYDDMNIKEERNYNVIKHETNKYKNNIIKRCINVSIKTILLITVLCLGLTAFCITNPIINSLINPEEVQLDYSKHTEIVYKNGLIIPTLYNVTNYSRDKGSTYTYEDVRFGDNVTTVEINYETIPKLYLALYSNELLDKGYKVVCQDNDDKIYAKNYLSEDYFGFVLINEKRIIYGTGNGEYQRIFNSEGLVKDSNDIVKNYKNFN